MKTHTELVEELARLQYSNYISAVGGKAFNGDPLPSAEEFFTDDSKKKQADSWRSAAASGISWAQLTCDLEIQDFAWAIKQMKLGNKVRRAEWSDKGMWIALSGTDSRPVRVETGNQWSPHSQAEAQGGTVEVLPSFIMRTADGKIAVGWLPSQEEMLSKNWELVE